MTHFGLGFSRYESLIGSARDSFDLFSFDGIPHFAQSYLPFADHLNWAVFVLLKYR